MFETSIKGPLFETADKGAIRSDLPNAPDDNGQAAPEGAINANAESNALPLGPIVFGCEDNQNNEGVIDLGDTAIILETVLVPTQDTDTICLAPSEVTIDNPIICFDSPLPEEFRTGTAGDDVLVGDSRADVIQGLGGDDTLRGKAGDDEIYGGGGADRISGNSGQDFINGNGGDDFIRADKGADVVRGGAGTDKINGGGGADRLFGGAGDDTIIGRTGDDTLKGNGGADVFQFRASDRNDTILDFEQGQDRIEILNGAASFAELSVEQDGADVVITFGSGQITVISDDAASFDANDFIF